GVAAIHFRTDGGAWQSYAGPFAVAADGTHAVDYYSTDNTGNTETLHSVTVKPDTVAPVSSAQLAGTQAADGSYVPSVDVTLTSTSPSGSGIFTMVSVDGSGWTQYAQSLTLSEGRHTVDYQSWDSAGFVEPRASTSIDVDLTPPTLGGTPSGVQTAPDVTV